MTSSASASEMKGTGDGPGCPGILPPDRREELDRRARRLRATCIRMAFDGREGHLKSALSCLDILNVLYDGWLAVAPDRPRDRHRDRFLLGKGHAATALYAVLADRGFIEPALLSTYARSGSPLPNHTCRHALPILEISSGSLGHALGMGAGMLYGMQLDGSGGRVVVLMSDGETNEGSVWESAMFAAAHGMDRLVCIVDNNNMQAVGRTDALTGHASIEEKFRAFGWAACTIDGHDVDAIAAALAAVPLEKGRPTAIIARTVAGAGVSFMEDQVLWHYRVPSQDDLERALAELGEHPIHMVPA